MEDNAFIGPFAPPWFLERRKAIREIEDEIARRTKSPCPDQHEWNEPKILEGTGVMAGRWETAGCTRCGTAYLRPHDHVKFGRARWKVRGRLHYRERTASYEEYRAVLASPRWKILREQMIAAYGGCALCACPVDLHLHHRNYDNLGAETTFDVTLLCGPCHDHFHNAWASEDQEAA